MALKSLTQLNMNFELSDSSTFFNFEGATALGEMERKLYPMALWL